MMDAMGVSMVAQGAVTQITEQNPLGKLIVAS